MYKKYDTYNAFCYYFNTCCKCYPEHCAIINDEFTDKCEHAWCKLHMLIEEGSEQTQLTQEE